jgi:uncharacterized membrane protein
MPKHEVESFVNDVVGWIRLAVESIGVAVIATGVLLAVFFLLKALVKRQPANFTAVRLILARYLALALEFQLGADILSTAVAPSWNEIGQLAAIAVIRTGLNFFLMNEMKEEHEIADEKIDNKITAAAGSPGPPSLAAAEGAAVDAL